jgi:hypothetical protein
MNNKIEESGLGTTPPPKKDDKLFGADSDWQTNACIAQWDAEYAYSSGYRAAAFSLAQIVCDTHKDQDKLVSCLVSCFH